jgi:hypothetical protein
VPDRTVEGRHRREAIRFRELAATTASPKLRQILLDLAATHERVSDQIAEMTKKIQPRDLGKLSS